MTTAPTELRLRRVDPSEERYRVVWHGLEVGSIGLQQGAAQRMFWSWGIDTVVPARALATAGEASDRADAMAKFKAAWDAYGAEPQHLVAMITSRLSIIERSRAWRGGQLPGPGDADLAVLAEILRHHAPKDAERITAIIGTPKPHP